MAYFEQFRQIDAQSLYSGSITTTGVGSAIDTTSYGNIVLEVSGNGVLDATIEGSNDQTNWYTITLNNLNDLSVTDTITTEGGYQFKTTYQYIRYNIAYYTGSLTLSILGRSGPGASAADNLSAAFNPDTPINVKFGATVPVDNRGALILSDGIPYNLNGGQTYIFNLNGYSTIVVQLFPSTNLTVTATQSIDGSNWSPCSFGSHVNAAILSTLNATSATGFYIGAVLGQYLRLVVSGSATSSCSIILKSAAFNNSSLNAFNTPISLSLLNGAGSIKQNGTAVSVNDTSLPIGGSDPGSLAKRLLTDTAGRLYVGGQSAYSYPFNTNSPSSNPQFPLNAVGAIPATYQQVGAMAVQETAQFEGQTQTELLAQILLELKILNQQMYELPRLIASGQASNDPPELFRSEPSIFTI